MAKTYRGLIRDMREPAHLARTPHNIETDDLINQMTEYKGQNLEDFVAELPDYQKELLRHIGRVVITPLSKDDEDCAKLLEYSIEKAVDEV